MRLSVLLSLGFHLFGCSNRQPVSHGDAGPLPTPTLACQFATRVYTEELGYALPGILTGEWVFLDRRFGLNVFYDNGGPMREDRAWVRPAKALIQNDEWTRPLEDAQPSATPIRR